MCEGIAGKGMGTNKALSPRLSKSSLSPFLDAPMRIREIEFGSELYQAALSLRDVVLRAPLELTWSQIDLEGEDKQLHFALFDDDDKLIACAVAKPLSEHTVKVRQMAVDEHHRGKGAGRQLLEGAERILAERGFRNIQMDARKTAVGFYRKLGYSVEGDEFIQVTIPHFRMVKDI